MRADLELGRDGEPGHEGLEGLGPPVGGDDDRVRDLLRGDGDAALGDGDGVVDGLGERAGGAEDSETEGEDGGSHGSDEPQINPQACLVKSQA